MQLFTVDCLEMIENSITNTELSICVVLLYQTRNPVETAWKSGLSKMYLYTKHADFLSMPKQQIHAVVFSKGQLAMTF